MQRHVESACGGYVPRRVAAAELAGWSEEGALDEAAAKKREVAHT